MNSYEKIINFRPLTFSRISLAIIKKSRRKNRENLIHRRQILYFSRKTQQHHHHHSEVPKKRMFIFRVFFTLCIEWRGIFIFFSPGYPVFLKAPKRLGILTWLFNSFAMNGHFPCKKQCYPNYLLWFYSRNGFCNFEVSSKSFWNQIYDTFRQNFAFFVPWISVELLCLWHSIMVEYLPENVV